MGLCSPALLRELSILGFLLVAAFSSIFGAMLAVFVPQVCINTVSGVSLTTGNTTSIAVTTDCTLAQNVYIDISPFNAFALALNFLSLGLILFGYGFEFLRERFIVLKFDVNYDMPADYLEKKEFAEGKATELKAALLGWNKVYNGLFVAIALVSLINTIVSGVLVFSTEYYAGYRTVTTYVTNVLFLLTRLSNSIMLSSSSASEPRAQSINLVENLNFNVVAVRHRQPPQQAAASGSTNPAPAPSTDGQSLPPDEGQYPAGPYVGGQSYASSTVYPPPAVASSYEYARQPSFRSFRFDLLGTLDRPLPSRYGRGTEV